MPAPTALPSAASRAARVGTLAVALLIALTGLTGLAPPASAAGATVTGRLVTPDGKPVDAMEMSVYDGSPVVQSITGTNGTFTLANVPAGTYYLDAYDPYDTYSINLPQFTLTDGQTRAFGDIVVTPLSPHPNAKLTGHVFDPAGKPARGVLVQARTPAPLQTNSVVGGTGFTDRNGRFMIDNGVETAPAPGDYKLFYIGVPRTIPDETFLYGSRYSGNEPTWASAATVTVDSTLQTVPDVTVLLNGGVSGVLTGTPAMTAGTVTVFDADGEQFTSKATGVGGAYSITNLRPGNYYLRFSSPDGGGAKFIRAFWPGASSIAGATPVVVKSGVFRDGVDQTLSDQLTTYKSPTISGRAVVGSTLTAAPGSWSLTSATEYSYQWLRAGVEIPAASAKTYKPVAADATKSLSVRITARYLDRSGTATSASTATVKFVSTVTARASYTRSTKKLKLTVKVAVPGLSNPGGTVTVKEGSRTIRSGVAVRNGVAVVTILRPKPGAHKYSLRYSGTSKVLSDTGSVRYTVPR